MKAPEGNVIAALWANRQSHYSIAITDFNSTVTDANDLFVRMLGYENKKELVGRSLLELCPTCGAHVSTTGDRIALDDDYHRAQVQCSNRLFQAGCSSCLIYMFRKDGIVVPVDVALSLFTDDAGFRIGTVAVCIDSTQRLKAEKVTKGTRLLLDIFATTRDGIYVSDGLGKCIMINQAFCDMTGYTQQELIGSSAPSLLPDNLDAAVNQRIVESMRTHDDMSLFETTWRQKSGAIFPVEVCLAVLKDANGEDNGIVATVRDITDRQNAEKETVAAKAFLENVFIHASEGMYVTDAQGCFIMVNQAFCDITGYTREELIGQYVPSMLPFDPAYSVEEFDAIHSGDDFSCFESRWQKKDGTLFSVEVRLAELRSSNDGINGLVGIVCDTTARKRLEQELEARVRERTASLEEMNKALTVLLRVREEDKKAFEEKIFANFSGLVLPYLEKLKASRLDERQRASLSIIESNLKSIIAPFSIRAAANHHALTPAELQIANLIKQGFKTKEIAQITGLSSRTIDHTRGSIRSKLGIIDRKTSLCAYLFSSSDKS